MLVPQATSGELAEDALEEAHNLSLWEMDEQIRHQAEVEITALIEHKLSCVVWSPNKQLFWKHASLVVEVLPFVSMVSLPARPLRTPTVASRPS